MSFTAFTLEQANLKVSNQIQAEESRLTLLHKSQQDTAKSLERMEFLLDCEETTGDHPDRKRERELIKSIKEGTPCTN